MTLIAGYLVQLSPYISYVFLVIRLLSGLVGSSSPRWLYWTTSVQLIPFSLKIVRWSIQRQIGHVGNTAWNKLGHVLLLNKCRSDTTASVKHFLYQHSIFTVKWPGEPISNTKNLELKLIMVWNSHMSFKASASAIKAITQTNILTSTKSWTILSHTTFSMLLENPPAK